MSGKKFYFPDEQGGITFKTERQIGHVRIPNYVYDLWLPVLGVAAIGVYSVYCRLEREGTCKGMTQRRLAKMCHIGTSKLLAINTLLQKHQFIRIRKPEKLDILRHLTMEITVMDAPKELSKEVIDAIDGYELLSPWLMELPETPDGASGSTKRDLDEAPDRDSVFEALCLNTSDVEGNPPAQNSLLGESSQPKPQPNTNPLPESQPVTDPATPGDPADTQSVAGVKTPKPLVHIAVSGGIAIAPPACFPGAPGDTTTTPPVSAGLSSASAETLPAHALTTADLLVGIGDFIPGDPGPDGILGPLATVTTADLLVGIGDFVPGIPGPDGITGPDCILPHAGDTTSVDPPARVPALDDLPVLSAIFGYPEPPRNYLTDLFNHANRDKPGDSDTHIRPKHWETVSDDEYAICRRVADLWCGGRLPYPGSIEAHCGAAGWLLHDLNGGNLSACIRVLDEYHRYYEDEQMSFTVAGPKSLVAVLPAFLAQSGSGGEAGVIRLGG